MSDPYIDLINEQWHNISMMYNAFRDRKPIIEYQANSNKIYSYPAYDYIDTLTTRTRENTIIQYNNACKNNQFSLFVKDKKQQKLKSYIFDVP